MGMYTSFYKQVPCWRCRQRHNTEFQVKFGDDALENFQDGERVPRDFRRAHGDYGAVYNGLCQHCSVFLKEALAWLERETLNVVRQAHVVELEGEHGKSIRLKGKTIATFWHSGGVISFSAQDVTPAFKNLCKTVQDFWKAHLRAIGGAFAVEIKLEKQMSFSMKPNAKKDTALRLRTSSDFDNCVVRVGKTFQVLENREMPVDKERYGTLVGSGKKVYMHKKDFVPRKGG